MNRVSLLDCTLRDGGFVNSWKFGAAFKKAAFECFVEVGIEFVEVGYLRDDADQSQDTTEYNTMAAVKDYLSAFGKVGKPTVMIDYGSYDLRNLNAVDNDDFPAIRVTFRKEDRGKALEYIQAVIDLGYSVFAQPVSVTEYDETELVDLIKKINKMNVEGVAIVDTYGLLLPNDVEILFRKFDENLAKDKSIGLHFHNNLQQAFANIHTVLSVCDQRDIIIDTSCMGMAKAAGNAYTETLCHYLNTLGKAYKITSLLEFLDIHVQPLKDNMRWGYSIPNLLSAINGVNPKYSNELFNDKLHSIETIHQVLSRIPNKDKKKFRKDALQDAIEQIHYFTNEMDLKNLVLEVHASKVIILGPGTSLKTVDIEEFNDDLTQLISVNFLPETKLPIKVFISNTKRALQISKKIQNKKNNSIEIISTNKQISKLFFDCYEINGKNYSNSDPIVGQNGLLMCLNWLEDLGFSEVAMIGFDGYSDKQNYISGELDYKISHVDINTRMKKQMETIQKNLKITFITESEYEK